MKFYMVAMLAMALIIGGCLAPGCPDVDDPVCGSDGVTYRNVCFAQEAGVESIVPGACEATGCSDSDGGKEIFTIGQVVDSSGTYDDDCADAFKVDEMFCEGGEAMVKAIPCPTGYECQAGACVESRCADSDGGVDETEKGTASAGSDSETDSCLDKKTVKEYYCASGNIVSRDIACDLGMECSDGACVESACEDSDGLDANVKGTTTKGATTQSDICIDSSRVKEYFCEDGLMKNQILDCQSGYECLDGKCAESVCVDSDFGKDQYTKGTVSYGQYSQTDSCYSSNTVIEYYCVSDTVADFDKINCGTGHECLDGACEPIDCEKQTTAIDEENVEHEIVEYDDTDPLTLHVGEVVQLNNGLMLRLYSVSGTMAVFRLYLNHTDLLVNDIRCGVIMNQGDSDTDLCGEDTEDIEVVTVNDVDDYVELVLEEWYVMEYYNLHGSTDDWTDDPTCPEDHEVYPSQMLAFFPYADTSPSGVDIEGRNIVLFGQLATLEDVDTNSIEFILGGENYNLEDGDNFQYKDEEYEIELTFQDDRLKRVEIDLD